MKRKNSLKKRLIVCLAAISGLVILKVCVWDPENNRWLIRDLYYRPPIEAKLTIAPDLEPISTHKQPLQPAWVLDASKLDATLVAGIFQPKSVAEIRDLIAEATRLGQKISMSGARHTMGGQIAFPNALHLDMRHFDRLRYNDRDRTVTVQSGATWKQIQRELGQHGRAVRVMQDSNIFTVGGSLSSNIHGKDPRFGSLIESVVSFKLLNAAGQEVVCSRSQNSELFRSAIGGMGLFGVITEVTLNTDENATYHYTVVHKPLQDMIAFMEAQIQQPDLEMIEAQMAIDQSNFLQEAQIYYFNKIPTDATLQDDVMGENNIWLRKLVYRTSRTSDWGKQFRWFMQKQVGPQLDPQRITRNSAMAAPFRTLELEDPNTTDVLQEYFIPTSQVNAFLTEYKRQLQANKMQLLNVTVRKVKQDDAALVSYATTDMYAFVSYYKINKDESGLAQMTRFTQSLMDYLNTIDAKFYLAYRGYYMRSQIHQMYPNLATLFQLKRQYDPTEVFSNKWYEAFR
ncbi:FAD-binding oxidoreductase [Alkalinema pantanalense CENA528]|uniref:FAD-binding oxidoreductase n=1 Tax=Alkalinema pantanalense TaxID=1620705 RepID=UPI003D6F3D4D